MISSNGILKRRINKGNGSSGNLFSVVDAGTNTFRLLVAYTNLKSIYNPLCLTQKIVRLGEGFYKTGEISKEAERRACTVFKEFIEISRSFGVSEPIVYGTSIFREAKNSARVRENIYKSTGLKIKVLLSEEEAELSVLGVVRGFNIPNRIVLFDIGGGSTEFVLWDKEVEFAESLQLGVVHLTEEFLKSDPPNEIELKKMETKIEKKITILYNKITKVNGRKKITLIGTAGTVTTIGALVLRLKSYEREKINKLKIGYRTIENLYFKLSRMKKEDRTELSGMVKGREDLILAGIALVLSIMRRFRADAIMVSDFGLLEGLAIKNLETKGGSV